MNNKTLGLLLAAALLLPPSSVWAANLVSNPGFESGVSFWKELFGFPSTIETAQKRSGVYSASKYVGNVSGQDYWSQVYQEVALTANQPVYAKIYVKTTFSPEATARAGLMLQFLNSSNQVVGSSVTSRMAGGTLTGFRLLEVSVAKAPAGTAKVRMSGIIWALKDDIKSLNTGKAYFDDASLDKIFKAPALQTGLLNGGFENGVNDWIDPFGVPAVLDKTVKQAGVYSVKKTVTSVTGQDFWTQIYQDIAIAPAKIATGKIYIKTGFQPISSAVAGIQIEYFNAANQVIGTVSKTQGGTTGWAAYTVAATAPAGTVKLRLSAFIWAPQGDLPSVNGTASFNTATLTIQ